MVDFRARQGVYQMSVEHHIMPESREALKEIMLAYQLGGASTGQIWDDVKTKIIKYSK